MLVKFCLCVCVGVCVCVCEAVRMSFPLVSFGWTIFGAIFLTVELADEVVEEPRRDRFAAAGLVEAQVEHVGGQDGVVGRPLGQGG